MTSKDMNYEILLFDLDGTLTDPKEGITNAVKYALSFFNIEESDEEKLIRFIGPPLIDGFMNYYRLSKEDALLAREKYRVYYSAKGVLENEIFKGVKGLLIKLKKAGKRLMVATSKPTHYAEIILKHFDIYSFFEGVFGSEFNEEKHQKSDVIRRAIEKTKEGDFSKILMIGDRKYDLIAANEVGVDCACVLFGYGKKEEFLPFSPKYIVADIGELERLLL